MKFRIYTSVFLITISYLTIQPNNIKISELSNRLMELYKTDQISVEKEFQKVPENERQSILNYIVIHYILNESAKQSALFDEKKEIQFLHTIISYLYPELRMIKDKYNWNELSEDELKELSVITLNILTTLFELYPDQMKAIRWTPHENISTKTNSRFIILKKIFIYALECSIEYLSDLFLAHKEAVADAFISQHYLNNDFLLSELINKFLQLKGHKLAETKDWIANVFGLERVLNSIKEQKHSELINKLINQIQDSILEA